MKLADLSRSRLLALSLVLSAIPAHATAPPPPAPPILSNARMTATVKLVEAHNGQVTKITKLCRVSGKIPVYSDNGSATLSNTREISGCNMTWKGKNQRISVSGAIAISKGPITFATASVSVVPPDAIPLCSICGPQPLADSSAKFKVSGVPKSLTFNLNPNPVSMLNAKPTVWLEAEIEVVN
ncbi:hypothetical protein [Massilia sp. BJB1822]|uniref:hypothetical protein n=1 Tax=Massilia sp. BJB1822 TaxID=2744470 RepID=UPI0015933388|nr:hypothetical protein [Massilia sp. BJB1822]NVE01879.1 hypothetical protein [Massilia sp. BJB1822]